MMQISHECGEDFFDLTDSTSYAPGGMRRDKYLQDSFPEKPAIKTHDEGRPETYLGPKRLWKTPAEIKRSPFEEASDFFWELTSEEKKILQESSFPFSIYITGPPECIEVSKEIKEIIRSDRLFEDIVSKINYQLKENLEGLPLSTPVNLIRYLDPDIEGLEQFQYRIKLQDMPYDSLLDVWDDFEHKIREYLYQRIVKSKSESEKRHLKEINAKLSFIFEAEEND